MSHFRRNSALAMAGTDQVLGTHSSMGYSGMGAGADRTPMKSGRLSLAPLAPNNYLSSALEATYPGGMDTGFGSNYRTDRGSKDIALPGANMNLKSGRNGHARANTMLDNYQPVV